MEDEDNFRPDVPALEDFRPVTRPRFGHSNPADFRPEELEPVPVPPLASEGESMSKLAHFAWTAVGGALAGTATAWGALGHLPFCAADWAQLGYAAVTGLLTIVGFRAANPLDKAFGLGAK